MAANRARIMCINRTKRTDPNERIQNVGGFTNEAWTITLDTAIAHIKSGAWTFYTHEGGKTAEVIIARHNGHEYLKTEADGVQPDNLLKLPDCPLKAAR